MMRPRIPSMFLLAALAACDNAGSHLGLPALPEGAIGVGVILDRDGNGVVNSADTIYTGARVALFVAGSTDTFRVATSDDEGLALFEDVPIGRYRFAIVPGSLGDSLPTIIDGEGEFRLIARPDSLSAGATVVVGYPVLSIAELRTAAPGRRVFVRGLVASPLQFFTDSATYLTSGNAHVRITSSDHRPGRPGNNIGDSVSVFGTTGVDKGQPVMFDGLIQTLAERPAPVPIEVSVADVDDALNGTLDAALVRVGTATIGDTVTVGVEFHVELTHDTETSLMVIDSTLHVVKTNFAPGRGIVARGVLVPDGTGKWFLKPRPVNGEIVLN